jgi:hypothetical protein
LAETLAKDDPIGFNEQEGEMFVVPVCKGGPYELRYEHVDMFHGTLDIDQGSKDGAVLDREGALDGVVDVVAAHLAFKGVFEIHLNVKLFLYTSLGSVFTYHPPW